ncbi:leucine-rich repeat-containing protein 24-like [Chrysoperla carnea]|uniref:leucine-rich repeat-containing protein 24-like n=1 Tax=Chrysoperla carnea TaxID=189513 RepID=UPI001D0785DF|nr:leucine-rich repeat-containing protein 24-like [Chrysoperla carnea]
MGVSVPKVSVLLLSIALLVQCSPDWTDECPSACRCKWSSGKKTALCRDAGFTSIPASLNSDMQVLDLTGNAIPYLTEDAFRSVGLINLQRVFIKSARVREVHKDAFRDLIILVEVDISDNLITSLHPDTFVGNLRLKVLYLSGNPLRELRAEQFAPLPHLRTIELINCQLTIIHDSAFKHVFGLESLNLKDNKLSQLSETVFAPITQLKTLVLDGNPWYCDCRLRGFRNWFLASNLHRVPIPCHGPRQLAGLSWQKIPPERFACAPQVSVTDKLVQMELGGNVTIGCHVRGDPEPKVTWLYNGHEIGSVNATHPDQVLLIEVEEGLLDKWINISIFNVSDLDAGDYSCVAQNVEGTVSRNITLVLPAAVVVSTLSHEESSYMWVWLVSLGSCILVILLITSVCVCCVCSRKQRRRKRHRRKARLKGSVSFTDQEKKLLDLSITTTERQSAADSCEMLGGSLMMDMQPSSSDIACNRLQQQPPQLSPIEMCDQLSQQSQQPPVHITIESHGADGVSLCVYPPPPEFSTSILPVGAFGNILISVSVSQDPNIDIQRYPDLLDIPHRSSKSSSKAISVAAGPDIPYCLSAVPENYATLPRRQLRPTVVMGSGVTSVIHGAGAVQYDNMGPRVTAGGSCSTLSLPDVDPNAIPEDIPPPPPPPICSPITTNEYVSL